MNRFLRNTGLFVMFLAFSLSLLGNDDISLNAKAPSVVKVGENFRLTYEANTKFNDISIPKLEPHFRVVGGPSRSSSFQMINGRTTVSQSYSYVVRAVKEGKFNIPPAKIKKGGDTYASNSLKIEVIKGSKPQSSNKNNNSESSNSSNLKTGGNLFVRFIVNKRSAYVGEPISGTLKVYTKVNLANIGELSLPDFAGFMRDEIETPDLTSLKRENINGEIYNTGVIQKYLLIPQRPGELTIGSAEMHCVVRQRVKQKSIWDFGMPYKDSKVKIKSPPVKVKVKQHDGIKPVSYTGGVGNYSLKAEIDKKEVKANDALTFKITVKGNGNLKLVDAPDIKFPADFEAYDPEVKSNFRTTSKGWLGSKVFEWVLIPRHGGDFVIPSAKFSYFDLSSNTYKTLKTNDFNIKVRRGKNDNVSNIVEGINKENVKFLGKDIRYIKLGSPGLRIRGNAIIAEPWFYYIIAGELLILLLLIFLRLKSIKDRANMAEFNNRKARNKANKHLKVAKKYLSSENKEEFYEEVVKAVWGYLSDKLIMPLSDLNIENALAKLSYKGVDDELKSSLSNLVEKCEFARYAPSSVSTELNEIYEEAARLITKLEKNIKN